MNRVELMPLVTTYQGTGNLGICSVDCCKGSSCQDLWLIPIFPKSAESGCGMWARAHALRQRTYRSAPAPLSAHAPGAPDGAAGSAPRTQGARGAPLQNPC